MSLVENESNNYEPKTSVGKTLSEYKKIQTDAFKNIMKEAQDCYTDLVKKHPGEPPLYLGKRGDIIRSSFTVSKKEMTLDDLSYILPDPQQKRFSMLWERSNKNDDEILKDEEDLQRIRYMKKRIEEIQKEFQNAIERVKPDVSRLSELGYVSVSEDKNVITIGGLSIDIRSMDGAMIAELLNAEINGEKEENILEDLRNLGLLIIKNGKDGSTQNGEVKDSLNNIESNIRKGHFTHETFVSGRWPGGIIKYKFRNIGDDYRRAVEQAMREWENATGCISFEHVRDSYWESVWSWINEDWILNIYEENIEHPGDCTGGYGQTLRLRLDVDSGSRSREGAPLKV